MIHDTGALMNTDARPNAAWKMERDADGIVWLTLDKPGTSTNVLGRAVLEELGELLEPLASEPPRGVVVRSAKKSGFIAGADIKEFTGFKSATDAYELIRARPARARPARSAPLPHCRGDSGLRARRRARARARVPLPRRRGR